MPVTAKLSLKLYEKLGEDVANELVEWFNLVDATYRNDLRELNELNFGRFDAKMEQRFAQFDAKLEQRFAEYDVKLEQRFAEYDVKLERRFAEYDVKLERRFTQFDAKIDQRFAHYDAKWERRFTEFDARLTELRVELHREIGRAKTDLIKWNVALWVPVALALIGLYLKT